MRCLSQKRIELKAIEERDEQERAMDAMAAMRARDIMIEEQRTKIVVAARAKGVAFREQRKAKLQTIAKV
eukprot:SAG11_NODE_6100_length_1388_cov_1.259891_2_plen_70_part_00